MITEERKAKFQKVIANQQRDLAVILENVHDPHNLGAVLRTCESIGITDVYVLHTDAQIPASRYIGKGSASGAAKWIDLHYYRDPESCMEAVRQEYSLVFGTHLSSQANSLYDLDLTQSMALMFGNEHAGISEATLPYLDGNFVIPQVGLVQSLNISVACAVTLYEAFRQREKVGKYHQSFNPKNKVHADQLGKMIRKHRKISDR